MDESLVLEPLFPKDRITTYLQLQFSTFLQFPVFFILLCGCECISSPPYGCQFSLYPTGSTVLNRVFRFCSRVLSTSKERVLSPRTPKKLRVSRRRHPPLGSPCVACLLPSHRIYMTSASSSFKASPKSTISF